MRNFIKIILFIFALQMNIKYSIAQIPSNDVAWIKNTNLSDAFSGSSFDPNKWWVEDSVWNHGLGMQFARNIKVSGGTLKIVVDTLVPSRFYNGIEYFYQDGAIISNDTSFKYGYLEISAKLPVGNLAYWPGFWLWYDNSPSPCTWYNEIDITENGPYDSLDGHQMGTNIWMNTNTCNYDDAFSYGYVVSGLPKLDSIFHKYALQWNKNNLYFYFDDSLVRHISDQDGDTIAQHHLLALFDIFVTPWLGDLPHMPKDTFEIDYFDYYTLNASCSSDLTICSPSTDYYSANPPRSVKKTITTGGGCSPVFNTDDKAAFRATDYILLEEGTTINSGTDLNGHITLIVEPCPQ